MSAPAPTETCRAARELGARAAAAAGLVAALLSLVRGSPLWLASLHGAGTLLVLAAAARLGTAALARALDSARTPVQPKKEG